MLTVDSKVVRPKQNNSVEYLVQIGTEASDFEHMHGTCFKQFSNALQLSVYITAQLCAFSSVNAVIQCGITVKTRDMSTG